MSETEQGIYVNIEGTDGSGSSTQIQRHILPWLESLGLDYGRNKRVHGTGIGKDIVATREPGGTEEGEHHRDILLYNKRFELSPEEEYERFRRQREVLSRDIVVPQLALGRFVVSERSYVSSFAYQGYGLGVDIEYIVDSTRESISPRMFTPDASILIHITPEEARRRFEEAGSSKDKIEERDEDFFQSVNNGYLEAAKRFEIPVIDGTPSREEVGRAVVDSIRYQIGEDRFDAYIDERVALRS